MEFRLHSDAPHTNIKLQINEQSFRLPTHFHRLRLKARETNNNEELSNGICFWSFWNFRFIFRHFSDHSAQISTIIFPTFYSYNFELVFDSFSFATLHTHLISIWRKEYFLFLLQKNASSLKLGGTSQNLCFPMLCTSFGVVRSVANWMVFQQKQIIKS